LFDGLLFVALLLCKGPNNKKVVVEAKATHATTSIAIMIFAVLENPLCAIAGGSWVTGMCFRMGIRAETKFHKS
jgi:hypothetical protein